MRQEGKGRGKGVGGGKGDGHKEEKGGGGIGRKGEERDMQYFGAQFGLHPMYAYMVGRAGFTRLTFFFVQLVLECLQIAFLRLKAVLQLVQLLAACLHRCLQVQS